MVDFPSYNRDNSEASAGLLFMRTYNKWHTRIKRELNILGITHPQFVVMTSIGYLSQGNEPVTQVMVSRLSGMDPMSVSQVLSTLSKRDVVTRTPHPQDSRAKVVALTETGVKLIHEALPIVEKVDLEFFGQLSEQENTFINMLHILSDS